MRTLFTNEETTILQCEHCKKDLLNPPNGHLLIRDKYQNDKKIISDFKWICQACDNHDPYRDWGWRDISDLFIPEYLVSMILGILSGLHSGDLKFSDRSMEKLMKLLLVIFPRISKELTPEQKKELEILYQLPRGLGGLG